MHKKIKVVLANTQVFQSIYINPIEEKWQNRIVFHDPIFPEEIPCVITLKSYRLENCIGLVVSAPLSRVRYFRKAVEENDKEEKWGKLNPKDILEKLKEIVSEIGGTVVYIQNENKRSNIVPKEEIERVDKDNTHTKKIKPKNQSKQGKAAGGYEIYAPSVDVFPININASAKGTWNTLVTGFAEKLYEIPDNQKRWNTACYWFEKICQEQNIPPYTNCNALEEVVLAKKELNNLFFKIDVLSNKVRKSRIKMQSISQRDQYAEIVLSKRYDSEGDIKNLMEAIQGKFESLTIKEERKIKGKGKVILASCVCNVPFIPKTKNDICLLVNEVYKLLS